MGYPYRRSKDNVMTLKIAPTALTRDTLVRNALQVLPRERREAKSPPTVLR
jgi:hypothetical protein